MRNIAPPEPFDLIEMEPDEVLPRTYTRAELLRYLEYCRRKCQETIGALSNEQANRLCRFAWGELPFAELIDAIQKVVVSDKLAAEELVPWENTRIIKLADAHQEIAALKFCRPRDP